MTLERARLGLYAVAAVAAAALVASVGVLGRPGVAMTSVAMAAIVPSLVLGTLGLAARFPVHALPLRRTSASRLIGTHAASVASAAGVWVLAWRVSPGAVTTDAALLFGTGAAIYTGAVVVHYLVAEVEASREAEAAALRYQVLVREAELRAFKAQVDPHFLFNSLNAVASLCGSRPLQAREMAQLMADFFRTTLRIGARERIPLSEEIDLISRYLAIEKVRFGSRLSVEVHVDKAAGDCLVPPLLLQPLVENAVRHGIASLVEGGTISIAAAIDNGSLHIRMENPADPDRPHQRGEGIGLQNARGRLAAISDGRAALNAHEIDGRYIVSIEVPL